MFIDIYYKYILYFCEVWIGYTVPSCHTHDLCYRQSFNRKLFHFYIVIDFGNKCNMPTQFLFFPIYPTFIFQRSFRGKKKEIRNKLPRIVFILRRILVLDVKTSKAGSGRNKKPPISR